MLSESIEKELFALFKNPPSAKAWATWKKKANGQSWNECWEWKNDSKDGYGKICVRYKTEGSHRAVCKWLYGDLPRFLVVDHVVCDNRPCCNPLHLIPTTNKSNSSRRPPKKAAAKFSAFVSLDEFLATNPHLIPI